MTAPGPGLDFCRTGRIFAQMDNTPSRPVPHRRFARQAHLGGMAGQVALATLGGVAQNLMRGRGIDIAGAALTPANALRVAGSLGHLRGAAMKLGQMLSMDSGIVLPAQVTGILAQLRADAPAMPPAQLKSMLDTQWGADWQRRFRRFDVRPIAAASIGQVHRAQTRDGRDLAIKVQFPGVAESIGPDIATLGRLLRLPGVLPRGLDIAPLLADAHAQLLDEANYEHEAAALQRFRAALGTRTELVIPALHEDFSTARILAMDFIDSRPIDSLQTGTAEARNRVAQLLITLVLDEIFTLGEMQTDPNFANYRITDDGRLVLLDFGATRRIAPEATGQYRVLMQALLARDCLVISDAMQRLGYFAPDQPATRKALILELVDQASAPLRQPTPYDFARSTLITDLAQRGAALGEARDFWHVPPADLLFLHRKIGGMFLLAQNLRAQVDLPALLRPFA